MSPDGSEPVMVEVGAADFVPLGAPDESIAEDLEVGATCTFDLKLVLVVRAGSAELCAGGISRINSFSTSLFSDTASGLAAASGL